MSSRLIDFKIWPKMNEGIKLNQMQYTCKSIVTEFKISYRFTKRMELGQGQYTGRSNLTKF